MKVVLLFSMGCFLVFLHQGGLLLLVGRFAGGGGMGFVHYW